jgi:hypothetical protein
MATYAVKVAAIQLQNVSHTVNGMACVRKFTGQEQTTCTNWQVIILRMGRVFLLQL